MSLPGDDQPQPQWGQQQGQPFQQPGWQPVPPTPGKAIAALILGICGFVICPLIPSILAVVFGSQAKNEIDASRGGLGGRGVAMAGLILGWIGIALCVLFALLIVVLAAGS